MGVFDGRDPRGFYEFKKSLQQDPLYYRVGFGSQTNMFKIYGVVINMRATGVKMDPFLNRHYKGLHKG